MNPRIKNRAQDLQNLDDRMNQELENYWNRIYRSSDDKDRFLRKSWFDGWAMYFSGDQARVGGRKYEYFSDENEEVAILPYGVQKMGPICFLSLAGDFFPRRGIPYTCASDELVTMVADHLNSLTTMCGVKFGPVIATDPLLIKLRTQLKKKNWHIINNNIGHDFGMSVPEDFDDYLESLSKSRRKKTDYYRRKLEKAGDVEFKHHKNLKPQEWEKIFQFLEDVESKAWVAKQGDAHFIGPDHQYFWQELVKDDWFSRAINVWMLYIDDKPVSYLFALDIAKERYVLASSYCEEVAEFRTGHHLELEMIRDTIHEDKTSFINNGLGNSGYKDAWGSTEHQELIEIVAFPPTIRGYLTYLAVRLKNRFSK